MLSAPRACTIGSIRRHGDDGGWIPANRDGGFSGDDSDDNPTLLGRAV
jgi:hypothetical protein